MQLAMKTNLVFCRKSLRKKSPKNQEATKLLLYIHYKSTVVTIISKIRGICMYIKKCTEFSLEIVSTVHVAIGS